MWSLSVPRLRSAPPYDSDARVYVLVEEARLRCEALRVAAPGDERRRELRRLHRDVGLSGLYVSSEIPAEVRQRLLVRVHARCDRFGGAGLGAGRGLQRVVRRAARELGRAMSRDGSAAEHRRLAQLHLLRALEFLLPPPAPRPSVTHVFRPRHLA